MINRSNLAVLRLAGSRNVAGRDYMGCVAIAEDGTIATNGAAMASVTLPDVPLEDAPPIQKTNPVHPKDAGQMILLGSDAKSIADSLKALKTSFPAQRNAFIIPSDSGYRLAVSDFEHIVSVPLTPATDYDRLPWTGSNAEKTISRLIPSGKPKAELVLDVNLIKSLADFFIDAGVGTGDKKKSNPVTLTVWDENHAVLVTGTNQETGQKISALLAAVKITNADNHDGIKRFRGEEKPE